jgi:AcrR family transcriptional regulator|tara:strand:+ start:228 stop:839 length:612 start_codon:yes stop_codon:yes gene_type:complete
MQSLKLITKYKADGRRQRSVNTQATIVDAMMILIKKGILEPTAQQVADEAGLGIRTVFRIVKDKETLFSRMDEKVRESNQMLYQASPSGSLKDRIEGLMQIESKGYEVNIEFIKATLANKWKYKTLEENYKKNQLLLKKLMFTWLPEISQLDSNLQEFLTAINSPNFWIELRENQTLSVEKAKKIKEAEFKKALGSLRQDLKL